MKAVLRTANSFSRPPGNNLLRVLARSVPGLAVWSVLLIAQAIPWAVLGQTTQPVKLYTPQSLDSEELDVVLTRFEKAGDDLHDLKCEVQYTVTQLIKENDDDPDEVQTYIGNIKFVKSEQETVSLINFKKWTDGMTWTKKEIWYLFDGRILLIADEVPKTRSKRELVKPGEKIDPFKLGEGPFPLPFGQKKADLLAEFEVTLLPAQPDDPADTDHLLFKPQPQTSLAPRYQKIELFVCRDLKATALGLPVKIVAVDIKEQVVKRVYFKKIKINKGLKAEQITLPSKTRNWPLLEE